jgi:signal transduction histidine kinase
LAITSESKQKAPGRYAGSHFHYAVANIILVLVVLIFLNIYSSGASQKLIYQNKESSMISKCQLTAAEIAKLEVLNPSTVSSTVVQMGDLGAARLIITNQNGLIIYDSRSYHNIDTYALLPEIAEALDLSTREYGNKSFSWQYDGSGVMYSHAATPIVSYGTVIGCVYIMEADPQQGQLILSLQKNMFTITFVLVLAVIVFSIVFSMIYSYRLRKILASMRIIREGEYSHKVKLGGQDELTFLSEEFNDLTDRLQTSESKRRQFVSDASHELKTPLASIKLLSDSILQNDMDLATVKEFVGDIGNEADRLNRMTQKLLSLTRIEGQQDGNCEIVNLAPTINRVVRMLSGIADANDITIYQDLTNDCPILILEDDLYQITFNLVENGIKYNLPGGSLFIRVYREQDNAVLEVRDTGVGIPEDAIGHVFERFYRVDKARSRKTGGSGLGLAIVRNMVERNQGSIRVESTPGQGSTFYVNFPIFDVEEEDPA